MTCEAHPYSFQVRESRRLLTLHLVPSRTVAGQAISFIFLWACVNDIPCEASARSWEAESDQACY
ncbi:hypothetical protein Taro_051665 [Colocasia esculenta]|uniref:Uncharacterized protein n=1 Tax=Colocasia esculenta TaxID=4460 RepID=A0A843XHJ1_COLES|nr:hypothetical protein [Colocasia esculenta]